ncbi:MAG: hypothetical protein Q7R41_14410, partial [Phycisphaerales bacterium]|nr:hypothetical protein [Phycisphaerales bacterium]
MRMATKGNETAGGARPTEFHGFAMPGELRGDRAVRRECDGEWIRVGDPRSRPHEGKVKRYDMDKKFSKAALRAVALGAALILFDA